MVRQKGFEPPAPSLGGKCSIQLSYWRMMIFTFDSITKTAPLVTGPFFNHGDC